jgi:hypothetical protein
MKPDLDTILDQFEILQSLTATETWLTHWIFIVHLRLEILKSSNYLAFKHCLQGMLFTTHSKLRRQIQAIC